VSGISLRVEIEAGGEALVATSAIGVMGISEETGASVGVGIGSGVDAGAGVGVSWDGKAAGSVGDAIGSLTGAGSSEVGATKEGTIVASEVVVEVEVEDEGVSSLVVEACAEVKVSCKVVVIFATARFGP
jgi:hypothetical protein